MCVCYCGMRVLLCACDVCILSCDKKKIIIIIVIITFKGAIEIFDNLLNVPRTISNTCAQAARAQSCANHVQHIERQSRATCRVACHVVRRDSSAIETEFKSHLF